MCRLSLVVVVCMVFLGLMWMFLLVVVNFIWCWLVIGIFGVLVVFVVSFLMLVWIFGGVGLKVFLW